MPRNLCGTLLPFVGVDDLVGLVLRKCYPHFGGLLLLSRTAVSTAPSAMSEFQGGSIINEWAVKSLRR